MRGVSIMSIINSKFIQKRSRSEITIKNGEELFEKKRITSLIMTKVGEHNVEFVARVYEDKKRQYNTTIEVSQNPNGYGVHEYVCECVAFSVYGGLCKHLIAACSSINLEYDEYDVDMFINDSQIGTNKKIYFENSEEKKKTSSYEAYIQSVFDSVANKINNNNTVPVSASGRSFSNVDKNVKKSSVEILNAISDFSASEREKYCVNTSVSDVMLEPVFHVHDNKIEVEFRIGKDKMYVVKNIENLVDAIKHHKFVSYGKKLEMVHTREVFCDECKTLLDYVLNLNFSHAYNGGYYSYNNKDKRYIDFDENSLDDFIDLYKGETVEAFGSDNVHKLEMLITEYDVKLPVYIRGEDNESKVKILFPNAHIIYGRKHVYIFYNKILYCCSKKFTERTKPILNIIKNNIYSDYYTKYYNFGEKSCELDLYKQDYGAFLDTLYPVMEKYMQVSLENIDFSKYENEEGKYEIYLDINENQDITCDAKAIYGNNVHFLAAIPDLKETYRDFKTEFELRNIINRFFPEKAANNKYYVLRKGDDERLADLVEEGVREIEQIAQIFVSDEFKKIKITRVPRISTGLSIKGDLLNVTWNVEGMSNSELNEILDSYRRKKKYHRLKSGDLLNLNGAGLDLLSDMQDDLHITKSQMKNGLVELPVYRALYLDSIMQENSSQISINKDEYFEELINKFEDIKNGEYKIPDEITAKLRPYQKEGYKWASVLAKLGFGGVLADDMGLGKTLQMIAFICSEKEGTHLVVSPASLVYNWESEFAKFAPSIKVAAVVGNANERKMVIDDYKDYNVLITSYDLLKRDIEEYNDKRFNCQIIDEAQYIKNPTTLAAKAVKTINSRVRFALTGTPIENRLSELWSIFEYLMPGYLYSYKSFKERFEEHIITPSKKEDEALKRLRKMIEPFLLRRLKKDVLKDLPDKVEEVFYAKFDDKQKELYQATEKNLLMNIKKSSREEIKENKLQILAELMRLRQICCDPSLVVDNYKSESAKLDALIGLIESAISNGHRILLFSQFTTMLDLIKERLNEMNVSSFMLTGGTSKKKRRELVESFQEGNADIFLISLKAGGTGLNLTAADIVIHYDPWWNVAAQNQATDRAHRIGQHNKVTVIKLIMKDSIEERILKLQDKKRELADKIISGEGSGISSLKKEELLELFE